MALGAWKAGVAERALQRGKVARSLAAISQRALHASWATWQAHALHSQKGRKVGPHQQWPVLSRECTDSLMTCARAA